MGTMRGMPAVWAHYLRLLVVPWPLCADYTGFFSFGPRVSGVSIVPPLLTVLAFVAVIGVAWRRGLRVLAFGLTWFALALGPVSNFIPVPIPAAERFLTLPLVGIALAAAAAAGLARERLSPAAWRVARGAGVAVLAAFAVLVNVRHGAWRDDATLWVDTVAVNPRACGAQSAVGGTMLARGIAERSEPLLRDAVAHQELALRLCADERDPQRAAMIYTRLGAGRAMLNQLAPARVSLERALALAPDSSLAVVWLGYVAFLSGDREQAARLLKYAIIDLGPPDGNVAQVAQWYVDKL
jgi:tetratricopeptide (TPR) repeat protein